MGSRRCVMAVRWSTGIAVGQGVVAGVVAERPLHPRLLQVHVAFEDELGVGRHLQVDRAALHQIYRFAAQKAGEEHLVQHAGQRRRGRVGDGRVGADGHRHLQPPTGRAVVLGGVLVEMPMHARGLLVVDLETVHAHVAPTRLGVAGEDQRQGDVAAGVEGPALEDGQGLEVDPVAGEHHLLARPLLHYPGLQSRQVLEPRQRLQLLPRAVGKIGGDERLHATGQLIIGTHAQGRTHALVAAELVDEHGDVVARGMGEEKRRPSGLPHPIGHLGDLKHGVDGCVDGGQLAAVAQKSDEVAKVLHIGSPTPVPARALLGRRRASLGRPCPRRRATIAADPPAATPRREPGRSAAGRRSPPSLPGKWG